VASHSKTFTATAIMQLVEQGILRLDDPLGAHIPWLGSQGSLARVTLRQALNHTGGLIRDGSEADYWQLDDAFPDEEGLRRLVAQGGAALDANETFKYSNIGYALLGLVVEAVSGLPYNAYVTRHIIERLGLADTGPETDAHAQERLATGYTVRRLGLPRRPIPDVATRALSPATGFYSTAEDLCRYAAAHFLGDARLLSDAAKREMQQPYWTVEQADEHYGLGFSVATIGERRIVGHGGGFPGHATRTLLDPRDRLVVVVLVNEIGGPADTLARAIVTLINFALRQPRASEGRAPDTPVRFTGRFVNLWGVTDVATFGDTVVALSPEGDDPLKRVTWLTEEDEDMLRMTRTNGYGAPGETLRYVRDGRGHVAKVVMGGLSLYPVELYRARQ
jgi:CubicO group peptidase (beta-lactamase class C family)